MSDKHLYKQQTIIKTQLASVALKWHQVAHKQLKINENGIKYVSI